MAKIVQLWSGGKDSTCAGFLHLQRGDEVHFVCFIPYFDDDIPMIPRVVFDFLYRTADFFRSFGAIVTFVKGSMSYYDYCTKLLVKGFRKGSYQSYPCINRGQCGYNRDCKSKACSDYANTLIYDYKDISICADEVGRKKLNIEKKEISILIELGYTQRDSYNFCRKNNLLSPSYEFGLRDGCMLCPHGASSERVRWFSDYAEYNAKERLYDLQCKLRDNARQNGVKEFYPLRGKHYFIENADFISPNGSKISMFGDTIN